MRYSVLDQTGARVSRICLGTATFGVPPTAQDADRIVAYVAKDLAAVKWVLISHGGVLWPYGATFSDHPLLLTVFGRQMVLYSISPGPRPALPSRLHRPRMPLGRPGLR
jgi:hypothetical protein